jgi:hypothetical protein
VPPPKIFVIWTKSIKSLELALGGVVRHPTRSALGPTAAFEVPGLSRGSGYILPQIVDGIRQADRVIAYMDRANLNIGFEVGLALGLGKPIALTRMGEAMPTWVVGSPFQNLVFNQASSASQIERMSTDAHWTPGNFVARVAAPPDDETWFLCPAGGAGETYLRAQQALRPEWKVLPHHEKFLLPDLPGKLGRCSRMVWTIAPCGHEEDDGRENVVNATVSGWFLAQQLHDPQVSLARAFDRLRILRDTNIRRMVDIETYETVVRGSEDLEKFIGGLARPTAVPVPASRIVSPRDPSSAAGQVRLRHRTRGQNSLQQRIRRFALLLPRGIVQWARRVPWPVWPVAVAVTTAAGLVPLLRVDRPPGPVPDPPPQATESKAADRPNIFSIAQNLTTTPIAAKAGVPPAPRTPPVSRRPMRVALVSRPLGRREADSEAAAFFKVPPVHHGLAFDRDKPLRVVVESFSGPQNEAEQWRQHVLALMRNIRGVTVLSDMDAIDARNELHLGRIKDNYPAMARKLNVDGFVSGAVEKAQTVNYKVAARTPDGAEQTGSWSVQQPADYEQQAKSLLAELTLILQRTLNAVRLKP